MRGLHLRTVIMNVVQTIKDMLITNSGAERSEGDKWLTGFTATENCGVRADDGKIVTAARSQNYSKTGYLNKKVYTQGYKLPLVPRTNGRISMACDTSRRTLPELCRSLRRIW